MAEDEGELLRISWTPLFRARLPMDPAFLADRARELAARREGVALSNRGGWQSDDLLPEFREAPRLRAVLEALETLARRFVETYKRADGGHVDPFRVEICNLWANVNAASDWNAAHHHPGAHLAGILYAEAPEGCGPLVLHPPYTFFDVAVDHAALPRVTPETGAVLLFPADVVHATEPGRGDGERVSYAFNLRYRPEHPDGRVLP